MHNYWAMQLVELLDNPLHNYFKQNDCLNYFFCFRWVLIQLKRQVVLLVKILCLIAASILCACVLTDHLWILCLNKLVLFFIFQLHYANSISKTEVRLCWWIWLICQIFLILVRFWDSLRVKAKFQTCFSFISYWEVWTFASLLNAHSHFSMEIFPYRVYDT